MTIPQAYISQLVFFFLRVRQKLTLFWSEGGGLPYSLKKSAISVYFDEHKYQK